MENKGEITQSIIKRLLKESFTVIVLVVISYYFIQRERLLFETYKENKEKEVELLLEALKERNLKVFELYERLIKKNE